MNRIVERCPSCGVEHDHRVHECEACGSSVRHWCRAHSREIGWLDGPVCVRCDDDEFRRTGRRPVHPPPAPEPVPAAVSDTAQERLAALLRERLRTAAEERERAASPVPAPPPAAEPAKERKAPAPARPGILLRLYDALLTVLWTGIVLVLATALAGGMWAYATGQDVVYYAAYWGTLGGFAGVGIGVIRVVAGLFRQTERRG